MLAAREIADIIDSACVGALSFLEVGGRVESAARSLGGEPSEENPLAPFVAAFRYDFAERHSRRRDDYGVFVPMIETATYTFPPRIDTVPESVQSSWAEIAPLVREPAARARLNDLLWVVGHGDDAHMHARAAVAGYTSLSEQWLDLDKVECLSRALELSLQINDAPAAADVAARIVAAAQAALAETDQKPGVALRLIQALLDAPEPPVEVDELLDAAADRYRDNIHIGDSVTDLRVSRVRGDSARTEQLRREQVQRWREHAAAAEGLVSFTHLQHGLELARIHGLADEAAAFLQALQAFDRESIEFGKIEAEAEVDTEEIERLIESLVEEDWPQSLKAFGTTGPPTGDAAENESFVRGLMKAHPIGFLFNRTLLGPENTVIRNIAGDEEHFAAQLAEHEARTIEFWGQLAAEGLHRMHERHGLPDTEALLPYFSEGVIAPECAEAFARGVQLYAEGRYDESALVVVPRIEAVMRELARRAGLVVIRAPRGERAGGVRSLGEVLISLRGVLDESWRRYLWNTLAEPLGLNLRNRLSHGLTQGTPLTAALLLHICCFLPLLRPRE